MGLLLAFTSAAQYLVAWHGEGKIPEVTFSHVIVAACVLSVVYS